jgi:hypothetical protein
MSWWWSRARRRGRGAVAESCAEEGDVLGSELNGSLKGGKMLTLKDVEKM